MSLEFYKTQAGRRHYDGTLPRIADALERIAASLEKPNTEDNALCEHLTQKATLEATGETSAVDQMLEGILKMSSKAAVAAREKAIAAERDATES